MGMPEVGIWREQLLKKFPSFLNPVCLSKLYVSLSDEAPSNTSYSSFLGDIYIMFSLLLNEVL